MTHTQTVRIPARLSRLGVDEIYYISSGTDWRERARRLQMRRHHKLYHLVQSKPLYGRAERSQ